MFNGKARLRDANEKIKYKVWQLEEFTKCSVDPIYFINNYIYINTKDEGIQLFKMYKYQEKAIARFEKYRFNINKWSRQVGKSTVVRGYIIWYIMFHKRKNVAMLANKLMLAKEQLKMLRESYELLPYWLQIGVTLWNKQEIQLANGSEVKVAASSSDGIRGLSPNLLYLDEFAFLKDHLADDFIASVMPSISSGKTTKIIITSTPHGRNHFFKMWEDSIEEEDAGPDEQRYVRSTVLWNEVPGRTAEWGAAEKARIGEQRFLQEYECDFIGSMLGLIDYTCLKHLKAETPVSLPIPEKYRNDFKIRLFNAPVSKQKMEANNWQYVAEIDTGFGMRKDYHVLTICLTKSNLRGEQVFVMSSNSVTIDEFCLMARKMLAIYGDPSLIIEYNGPGQMTYSLFLNKFDYPNILNFDKYGRGLYSNNQIKQNAVLLLKMYIQRGYMKVKDDITIKELMCYGQLTKNTWGASGGNHDDHVSSLEWIVFYMASHMYYGNEEDMMEITASESGLMGSAEADSQRRAVEFIKDPDAVRERIAAG